MRVSIRLDDTGFDVTLPDDVAIAELLPAVCDIGVGHGADPWTAPLARHVYVPTLGPLDPSTTLTEAGVADGDLLLVTATPTAPVAARGTDSADVLCATVHAQYRWDSRSTQVAALSAALCATAALGYNLLPGAVVPRLLLTAAAVASAATLAGRWDAGTAPVMHPIAVAAALVGAVLLPATMIDAPAPSAGIAVATVALLVLAAAGRIALLPTGDPVETIRVHGLLVSGTAGAAAFGAALAALGAAGPPGRVFGAVVATVLLTRAAHRQPPASRTVLLVAGITSATAWFVTLYPLGPRWTTGIAVAAMGLAVSVPSLARAPGAPAVLGAAERIALVATLPAAWWALELYR